MADLFCNNCGHRNDAEANFCSSCGQSLARSGDAPATVTIQIDQISEAALESTGVAESALIATRGPNAGSRFTLSSGTTTIGRHPDSDIFLDDVTVSRRHVEIERDGDRHVVHDVGSLNGTYLNRRRIDQPTDLANGDEVQVGLFKLVFVTAAES